MSSSNEKLVHQWWVFISTSRKKFYGPFFCLENTVLGNSYPADLTLRLLCQWRRILMILFSKRRGATRLPHGRSEPAERAPAGDVVWCRWPPRSPDLTPCDFFLWSRVFVASQSRPLTEFKKRIKAGIASLTMDTAKSLRRGGLPSRYLPSDSWSTHRVSVRCEESFATLTTDVRVAS